MKELGYGEEYKYAHDYNNNFADQEFYQKHLKKPYLYSWNNSRKQHQIF
jgi:putative ATPase